MTTELTLPATVTAKLAAIGSTIIGQPEACFTRRDPVEVGLWFRSTSKADGVKRCYMVVAAEKGVNITQRQVDDDTTGKYDGTYVGWQQVYTRVQISEPTAR